MPGWWVSLVRRGNVGGCYPGVGDLGKAKRQVRLLASSRGIYNFYFGGRLFRVALRLGSVGRLRR